MLVYTVTETVRVREGGNERSVSRTQTYEGFRRVWANGQASQVIATAFIDGEGDWWEIDPSNVPLALEELARFYRSQQGVDNVQISVYDLRR